MGFDKLKVYVPQEGPYGLEPEEGGEPVEEETCYLKSDVDAVIAELKDERDAFEKSLNEMTEAFMQSQRALWLARAISAHNAAMMWEILSDEFLNESLFTIDFRCVGDPDVTEFQIFRGCMDWMKIYENVERKCKAKVEEYK